MISVGIISLVSILNGYLQLSKMARKEEGMKRERKISILVVLLSVLAIAAPRPSTAQQPIRIGASIAITGRDAGARRLRP